MKRTNIKNLINRLSFLAVFLGIAGIFFGCFREDLDELEIPSYQPDIAISLVNADFNIEDIVKKFDEHQIITTDSNNVVIINYTKQIAMLDASEIIGVSNVQISFDGNTASVKLTLNDSAAINDFLVKQGKLGYRFLLPDNIGTTNLKIEIPKAIKQGVGFSETITIDPNDYSGEYVDSLDLSGYQLDLSGGNTFQVVYNLYDSASLKKIMPEDLDMGLNDLLYQYIDGYFGKFDLGEYVDTLRLSIFDHWTSGTVLVASPKINISANTSLGIPFTFSFSNFSASRDSESYLLQGGIIAEGITTDYPDTSEIGNEKNTQVVVDDENSNLKDFLSIGPGLIYYNFNLSGNLNFNPEIKNFALDTSKLRINLDLQLPMIGRIEHVALRDTFDINFGQINSISDAKFKIITENTLPNDVKLQMYFADDQLNILDSLFEDPITLLVAGQIDSAGVVTKPEEQVSYVNADQHVIDHLNDSKKIILKTSVLTPDSPNPVKYLSSNGLAMKIGLIAKVKTQ